MNERESLGVGQKCISSSLELGVEREDLQQYFDLEYAHLNFLYKWFPRFQKTDDFQGTPVLFKG